jgi:hypothetical protein
MPANIQSPGQYAFCRDCFVHFGPHLEAHVSSCLLSLLLLIWHDANNQCEPSAARAHKVALSACTCKKQAASFLTKPTNLELCKVEDNKHNQASTHLPVNPHGILAIRISIPPFSLLVGFCSQSLKMRNQFGKQGRISQSNVGSVTAAHHRLNLLSGTWRMNGMSAGHATSPCSRFVGEKRQRLKPLSLRSIQSRCSCPFFPSFCSMTAQRFSSAGFTIPLLR